jgi:hypothetical protein
MAEPEPLPDRPHRHVREEAPVWVAILLALAAVVAAAIGIRAAILADHGSAAWSESIREDVKRGAGLVEDVRFVYTEEAPVALEIAAARILAEEENRGGQVAPESIAGFILSEAAAQEGVAETLEPSSAIAKDPHYGNWKHGYEVAERLADVRKENPELVELEPDETEAEGSDLRLESSLLIASTIPVALAFLCGALADAFESRRRQLVIAGFCLVAIGIVLALIIELSHGGGH